MDAFTRDTFLILGFWMLPIALVLLWGLGKLLHFFMRLIRKSMGKILWPFSKNRVVTAEERPHEIKAKGNLAQIFANLPKVPFIGKLKFAPKKLFVILYFVALVGVTIAYIILNFYTKPYVLSTTPKERELYLDSKPATIMFDKPINKDILKIGTAPKEIEARLEFISPFTPYVKLLEKYTGFKLSIPLYTGVNIYPVHSTPYDTGVIFYLSDITNMLKTAGNDEYGQVLSTPKFPIISGVSLKDKQEDVPVNNPIQIELDSEATNSFKLIAEFTPQVDFTIVQDIPKILKIKFNKPLEQGTTYKLDLQRAKQSYDFNSKTIDSTEDPEKGTSLTFKTVTPPGIKSISTTGTSVSPKSSIVIIFTEPMNTESVAKGVTIAPQIPYDSNWNDAKTELTIKPKQPLEKGTAYKLTFSTSLETAKGGVMPKEFTHQFETLGYVKLTSSSPKNGATNASVSQTISLTFDQDVDHASAQQHVTVSPGFNYSTSWSGNTLNLKTNSLSYQTKYTITVKAGVKSVDGWDSKDDFSFSFSTRSQVITIWVPSYDQIGTFDCNLTAAVMALEAKGVNLGGSLSNKIDTIRNGVGAVWGSNPPTSGNPNSDWIYGYGVHWDPIASFVRSRGRGAVVMRNWNLAGIADQINRGNPVIVFWYNGVSNRTPPNSWYSSVGAKPGLHSVTVYGYKGSESNPSGIYVHDPWSGFHQEYYTAGAFLSKWSYFSYTAVIVQ